MCVKPSTDQDICLTLYLKYLLINTNNASQVAKQLQHMVSHPRQDQDTSLSKNPSLKYPKSHRLSNDPNLFRNGCSSDPRHDFVFPFPAGYGKRDTKLRPTLITISQPLRSALGLL